MNKGSNQKRSRARNGKRHGANKNQVFDSNGPDVRVRGTAHQVLEKYLSLARDASSSGDRISAEAYYQHAEHYYRIISAQAEGTQTRPPRTPGHDRESQEPLPEELGVREEAVVERSGQPAAESETETVFAGEADGDAGSEEQPQGTTASAA